MYAGPFRIADMHYPAGETHRRHTHAEVQISIIVSGSVEEQSNGIVYRGLASDVVVKPAEVEHADVFEKTRIITLVADPRHVEYPIIRYGWHRAGGATAAAIRLSRLYLSGELQEDDVDDFLAAIPSPPARDHSLARRAATMLDESFGTLSSLRLFAASLGVHPVYLARVFRQHWGCSPRSYVQQLRVRAAAHTVVSTRETLACIAVDSGFADQAHMSRAFTRYMGISPAALRRLAHS